MKYLGFSASVLVLATYLIAKGKDVSSANLPALNGQDSLQRHSGQGLTPDQNTAANTGQSNVMKEAKDLSGNKKSSQVRVSLASEGMAPGMRVSQDSLAGREQLPGLKAKAFETGVSHQESENPIGLLGQGTGETVRYSANEKKKTGLTKNSGKAELYIPEEPGEMNSYTATLYERFSFCAVLKAYKFPGKVLIKDGDFRKGSKKKKTKGVLRTTSCNNMADMANVRAIWLKGQTAEGLTLSIDKKLRNIVLIKSDGQQLRPEAISHYYTGLGVITGYTGKFLKLAFKHKVALILFFKNAEAGDRIVVDGSIEAVITAQP